MKQKLLLVFLLAFAVESMPALAQEVFPKLSTASETHWYTIKSMNLGYYLYAPTSAYTASAGAGGTAYHISSASSLSSTSYWKFVDRGDGTMDIMPNYTGDAYAIPTTTKNNTIKIESSQPSTGWKVAAAATSGQYVIYSGTIYQWHQTTAANGWVNNSIIYWNSGSLVNSDAAYCFQIEEVDASNVFPLMYRDSPVSDLSEVVTGWYQFSQGSSFAKTATETLSSGSYYPLSTASDPNAGDASTYVYVEKEGDDYYFQSPNGHYLNSAAASTKIGRASCRERV